MSAPTAALGTGSSESFSVGQEGRGFEPLLVLEQHVVHRPELALGAHRFRRLGCQLGMRMHGGEREVAIYEAQLVAHTC
jgi:hypothetical protein